MSGDGREWGIDSDTWENVSEDFLWDGEIVSAGEDDSVR